MNTKYSLQRPPANTPSLYETDNGSDPLEMKVFAHYFLGNADWYILEYSQEEDLAFCFAELVPDMGEFGYTSMKELEDAVLNQRIVINNVTSLVPMHVQYESQWHPRPLRECLGNR